MPTELAAASGTRHLVLYDPVALPSDLPLDPDLDTPEPQEPPAEAVEALAASGAALVIHVADGDCEGTFRVFVDEELPPALAALEDLPSVTDARLEVPSGRLRADGAEFLQRPGETRRHGSEGEIVLSPGRYRVSARSLLLWKAYQRAEQVEARTTVWERFAARLYGAFGCLAASTLVLGFFALPGLGVYWGKVGWRRTLPVAGWLVAVFVVLWALFWLLDRARNTWPVFSAASTANQAFDRDYPDFVVELRLAEEPFEPMKETPPSLVRIE